MSAAMSWAAAVVAIVVISFFVFRSEWSAIFKAFAGLLNKTKKFGLGGIEAQDNPAPPSADERRAADEFFRNFEEPMLREQERIIREDLDRRRIANADDKERALIKSLALCQVVALFDRIHSSIWGSQFRLIRHINERPRGVTQADIDSVYEAAKAAYPQIYEHYTLPQWLGFIDSYALLTKEGDNFLISIRGRSFLQFVAATGKREPTFG
jgi:hypothetical protein